MLLLDKWVDYVQERLKEEYGEPAEPEEVSPAEEETEVAPVHPQPTPPTTIQTPPAPAAVEEDDDLVISTPAGCPNIYTHPEPVVDRKSVFVAHVAPVATVADVKAVLNALLAHKKIGKSTYFNKFLAVHTSHHISL